MKFKQLMILCAIFLFSFSVVTANEHYISDVTGLAGGNIPTDGSTVTFVIGMNNTGPGNITGITNGFRVYSPTGAEWGVVTRYFQCNVGDVGSCTDSTEVTVDDPWDFSYDYNTVGAFTGTITTGMLNQTFVNPFSDDGIGADTVGFGGFRIFEPGIPVGFNQDVWTITIGPVDVAYTDGQICIDSSFYPPAGAWTWSTTGGEVKPDWAGPFCYTIGVPPPPPSINPIGNTSIGECKTFEFSVIAVDTSGQGSIYSLEVFPTPLPTGATFVDNGNNTGLFRWTLDNTHSGVYDFEFIASLGGVADTALTTITVIDNEAPTVTASGPFIALADCKEFSFTVPANDPEGQPMTYSSPNLPATATLNSTGEFIWAPALIDVGTHIITFDVTDDCDNTTSIDVTFEVVENTAPVITDIPDASVMVCETITFTATATDNEGSIISYSIAGRPDGATFNASSGVFDWTPDVADLQGGGIYDIIITATDECGLFDSDNVQITVTPDIDPDITVTTPQEVIICKTLSFGFSAIDPQGTNVTLTADGLDADAVFTDNGDGTGNITWTPDPTEADTYDITILASDECGVTQSSKLVTINVSEDSDPVFSPIIDQPVKACEFLTFGLTASDPDNDIITFRMTGAPAGASINGASSTFEWTPTPTDVAGSPYTVTFYAADECGSEVSQDVIITVNANLAIAFDDATGEIVDIPAAVACELIEFTFTATDPEGVAPVFSGANLPGDATVTNEGSSTGKFSWTPTASDIGAYTGIEIIVSDNCGNSETETFDITVIDDTDPTITFVEDVNVEPNVAANSDTTITACQILTFDVTADDPDGVGIDSVVATGLPGDATFDGTTFSWTPSASDVSVTPYSVTFTAYDVCESSTDSIVTITVVDDTDPTITIANSDTTITACQILTFDVTADDPDGVGIDSVVATGLPGDASFDGTTFLWNPVAADVSETSYEVTFTAYDVCESTTGSIVTITVELNAPPVISIVAADTTHTVVEGGIVTFLFSASDPTDDIITFDKLDASPNVLPFEPDNNSVTFSWETIADDAGVDSLWLTATDECGSADTQLIVITVVENSLPLFNEEDLQAQIPDSPQQGDSIILDIVITDDNIPGSGKLTTESNSLSGNTGLVIWVDTTSIPDDDTKWSMTDNGDGTAKFIWATDSLTPIGNYTITFFADDGVDKVTFEATVGIVTSVAVLDGNGLPEEFYLTQNYPNPFNPETEIQFGVPERAYVSLAVYNVLGQKIKTLVDEVLSANRYTTYWDGSNDQGMKVATGIYFYKLETDQYHETKKMIMIK